jgi:predicted nucleic acid-binding protein
MVGFVLDCSIVAAWVYDDEKREDVDALFDLMMSTGVIVPGHWPFELGNMLRQGVRRKRVLPEIGIEELRRVMRLHIAVAPTPDEATMDAIWGLADERQLTFYDAAYLQLALDRGLPLATLDSALIAACRSSDLPVLP